MNFFRKHKLIIVISAVYVVMAALLIFGSHWVLTQSQKFSYSDSHRSDGKVITIMFAIFIVVTTLLAALTTYVRFKFKRIGETQNWLIDTVQWQVKLLTRGTRISSEGIDKETTEQQTSRWPWGNHHTETLGHLEAAARKWWALYDPSDLTTAPTNEMVSEWLQTDRGISREKARAIASMLRPDGLPTGPRK